MKIQSEFVDFYDDAVDNTGIVYRRKRIELGRVKELRMLKDMGIQTIDIKAVRDFDTTAKNLVVYTNPKKHDYMGKRIVEYGEAQLMYENMLASEFIEEANGITFKYLQIGNRRFRVYLKNEEPLELKKGKVIEVQEIQSGRGKGIKYPIFSIDYINVGGELRAVDFNEIQNLQELEIDRVLSKESIVIEIEKYLF